jgi:hypothetical protein
VAADPLAHDANDLAEGLAAVLGRIARRLLQPAGQPAVRRGHSRCKVPRKNVRQQVQQMHRARRERQVLGADRFETRDCDKGGCDSIFSVCLFCLVLFGL